MKNIILLIATLLTGVCHAQNFNKVYCTISYSYEDGEWIKGPKSYPKNMYVITEEYNIRITNKEKSRLITYGNPTKITKDDYVTYTWEGYDKDGNKCYFVIKKITGSEKMVYTVILENQAVDYIVEP